MRHGLRPTEVSSIPDSVFRDFAALSDEQFARVLEEVKKADDLRIPKASLSSLQEELGDNGSILPMVLSLSRSLVDSLSDADDFGEAKENLLTALRVSTDPDDAEMIATVVKRLDAVLRPWKNADLRRKRDWLQKGRAIQ